MEVLSQCTGVGDTAVYTNSTFIQTSILISLSLRLGGSPLWVFSQLSQGALPLDICICNKLGDAAGI